MVKNTIVQFVCFTTRLEPEEFIALWEPYARELGDDMEDFILQEAVAISKGNKFNYISQHQCKSADFSFTFMKGRSRSHFSEHKAKVVQAGGYYSRQVQFLHDEEKGGVKVFAFLDHHETELDFFQQQSCRHLNIYEAYFENCTYSYIMEYFIEENEVPVLVKQLKTRTGIEVDVFKECSLVQSLIKTPAPLL